jgi:starch synthase (maltosyl-transferring)
MADYLRTVNEIRRDHPALHWLRNLRFHSAEDENVLVFSKRRVQAGREDTIIVVANLDPHATRGTHAHLDLPALGLSWGDEFVAHEPADRRAVHLG